MIDPVPVWLATLVVLAVLAGAGGSWYLHRRVRSVESEAAVLGRLLAAERQLASRDPLTGLPNRRAFFHLGEALLASTSGSPMVAVVLDLDDFKEINDRWGHAAGDEVLAAFAHRLAAVAGDGVVARLGGDEFAGLLRLPDTDPATLDSTTAHLTEALSAPLPAAGRRIHLRVSVGLAPAPPATPLSDVLRHADTAMYRVKYRGRAARSDWSTTIMPTPSIHPAQRNPEAIAPADSYRHADPVWVYRSDSWQAGVVEAASPQAVIVTYRPPSSRGTGVDTLTAAYLVPREDSDPLLDRSATPERG